MLTINLAGQDLAYWVARANLRGSSQEQNVLRRHYGDGPGSIDPCDEPSLRQFVASKFGTLLPLRVTWP